MKNNLTKKVAKKTAKVLNSFLSLFCHSYPLSPFIIQLFVCLFQNAVLPIALSPKCQIDTLGQGFDTLEISLLNTQS